MKQFSKKNKIIGLSITSVLTVALIAGTCVAKVYETGINNVLLGVESNVEGEEVEQALAESDELCQKIGEESMVLLKNNGALPLQTESEDEIININVFGYGATDEGFLLKGVGSGSSTISTEKKVTLLDALEREGFYVNDEVLYPYENLSGTRPYAASSSNVYNLAEPDISEFDDMWEDAQDFSDIALFVISRDGGENCGEIPKTQADNANKTYLEISDAEQEMLDTLEEKFGTVIVLMNTTNNMHMGFLESDGIDAALYVGLTGQSASLAIPRILRGEVNPSGKTTDISTFMPDYDPTYVNNEVNSSSITYAEDIYYGYKWYETAYVDGYFDGVSTDYGTGYDGIVQYPFGHGLSYTDFSQEIVEVSLPMGSNLALDSEITVTVRVTNTGDVAGKDVVELYYTAPYYDSEIEKAEVNLLDFGKTAELEPGEFQDVELSFSAYDMASYDCYDMNGNGSATYELDEGEYKIRVMENSHPTEENILDEISYNVSSCLVFDEDPDTGNEVANRFTGSDAYADCPTDGSTVGIDIDYMTRSDFERTFPTSRAPAPNTSAVNTAATLLYDDPYTSYTSNPTTNVDSGLRIATLEDGSSPTYAQLTGNTDDTLVYNQELLLELADYDSSEWDTLLNQMSVDDYFNLVQIGGFHTEPIVSIGKPLIYDYDGPAGFNTNSQTGTWNGKDIDTASWTAYPSEALMGCSWNKTLLFEMGLSMGAEGNLTGINGWYAPGVNLHRSAYTARNYEYYSEDGVLSGKLAANVISGAKANGLYCYLKHFVCSEEGPNPGGVNTWITEQNLRENYLRPFEIAVKEGGSNAIMSAFNRVGANWCGSNYGLITEVLRGEWGFTGSVITDWTTGGSLGGMNPRQGVRAGNDLWLNPYTSVSGNLSSSNAIDVNLARNACKNVLYTFVDTWNYNYNFDDSELENFTKVDIGVASRSQAFPWWWVVLGLIDAIVFALFLFFLFITIYGAVAKRRRPAEEKAGDTNAGDGGTSSEEITSDENNSEE